MSKSNKMLKINKMIEGDKKSMIKEEVSVITPHICVNEKYLFYDLVEFLNKKTFKSYGDMRKYLQDNLGRVLIYVREGEGYWLKKDGCENSLLLNPIKSLGEKTKCVVKFKQTKINDNMEEETFLTKIRLHKILDILITEGKIKTYSSANFYPKMKLSSHIYNTWSGFEVDKGKFVPYERKKVKPLNNFIYSQICNDDKENYNYLLSWIKHIYETPSKKTMTTIILYSNTHGTGKGTFMNFLIDMVFGSHISSMGYGLEKILGRFNSLLENKVFIGVDEMKSKNRGEYSIDNEKLKNIIVEDKIQIERKNFPTYDSNNHLNFMINTNNLGIVRIDGSDRRFVPIQVKEDTRTEEYWDEIRENCITKDIAKHFIHYLKYDFKDEVSLRKIPSSILKNKMKLSSGHQGDRMIIDIKEGDFDITPYTLYSSNKYLEEEKRELLKGLIHSKIFYKMYKEWCEDTGERPIKKKTLLEYLITKNLLKIEQISFENHEEKRVRYKCYRF
jgi:hypothetical protein